MTISSPVGTVGVYKFTLADVFYGGSSEGVGGTSLGLTWPTPGIYTWTLPRHDGPLRIYAIAGRGEGAWGLVAASNAGNVRAYIDLADGSTLTVVTGEDGVNNPRTPAGSAGGGPAGSPFHGGPGGTGTGAWGGSGGGGGSGVLLGSTPILVAGGGGGAGGNGDASGRGIDGGQAGSASGAATAASTTAAGAAGGGDSTAGSGHLGGSGRNRTSALGGGGGGGGWFGGGGGSVGGGGASSWYDSAFHAGGTVDAPSTNGNIVTIEGDWLPPLTGGWSVGFLKF